MDGQTARREHERAPLYKSDTRANAVGACAARDERSAQRVSDGGSEGKLRDGAGKSADRRADGLATSTGRGPATGTDVQKV